jgi:hypothetical protein
MSLDQSDPKNAIRCKRKKRKKKKGRPKRGD